MPKLVLSPENPNRLSETDAHFIENGEWEKNGGRKQTRQFAKSFIKYIHIPVNAPFSFLDMGCALVDSIPVFRAAYPEVQFYGCDVSKQAVHRCIAEHGAYTNFFVSSIQELNKTFDVIYCSNIIEHIENHIEIVKYLTTLTRYLYVMVPYMELHEGSRLTPNMGFWHIATFDEHTFDSIVDPGMDLKVLLFAILVRFGCTP